MGEEDLETLTMIRVAGEFVTYVLFPGIDETAFAERIDWRHRDSASLDAIISPWRKDRYRIAIGTAVPDLILSRLQAVNIEGETAARAERLGGIEPAMTLAWFAGVAFFATHEACHAAAGHVAYQKSLNPETSTGDLPRPLDLATFRLLSELEADGAAAASLLSADYELMRTIEGLSSDGDDRADSAMMFIVIGVFATLELLASEGPVADGYPTPETRYLNVVAAVFRHVAPHLLQLKSGDYVRREASDEEVQNVANRFRHSILPALVALNHFDVTTPFGEDIAALLGGAVPNKSEAGRDLARYSRDRARFMRALSRFRETRMWDDFND
jgi:hypothetical protein